MIEDEEITGFTEPDTKKEKADRKMANARQVMRDDGLRLLINDARGRAYLNDLFERCLIFQSTFHANPQVMALKEGARSVGLSIYADIVRLDEDKILLLQKELRS